MRWGRWIVLALLVVAEAFVLYGIVVVTTGVTGSQWNWQGGIGGPFEAKEEVFLPLGNAALVEVHNDMGKVIVQSASGDAIVGVQATKRGFGFSNTKAEEALALVDVTVEKTADGYKVVADGPNSWYGRAPRADLVVTLPAGAAVQVQANMGSVRVEDVTANINIDADMGSIDLSDVKGNIIVEANMGSVELKNAIVTDKLDVSADMGSIDFQGRFGQENRIECHMGSIDVELAPNHPALDLFAAWKMGSMNNKVTFSGETQKRSARGVLGTGAVQGSLTVSADMGSITIK